MRLRRNLLPVVGRLAEGWDDLRHGVKLRLGLTSPPMLLPYRGFASGGGIVFGGRVIEDERVIGARPTRSRAKNLWRTFRRYETDEIRKARVAWTIGAHSGSVESDAQGFFQVETPVAGTVLDGPWASVTLRLEAAPGYEFEPRAGEVKVRVVAPDAAFGVISDIDDTIVETGARSLFKHWRTVALNSAEGRVAFPGISYFYRALAAGRGGGETNPIFYVSSSPWNLYDLFEDFMRLCDIPRGPMFLKDFGLNAAQWLTGSHAAHKLNAAERILDAYPALSFVLIGDTGQSDAVIYAQIVERFPGRVISVHLRNVTPKGFEPRVAEAIAAIEAAGVEVTSSPSLQKAAETAERLGLVEPGTAEGMRSEVERDRERLQSWTGPMPFRDAPAHEKPDTRAGPGT